MSNARTDDAARAASADDPRTDLARTGDVAGLVAQLDAGMPVDLADSCGNTLLMLAAYHGHAGAVTALLERGADVNRLNHRGQSPLAGAVFKAADTVVWLLLDAGADVQAGSPSAAATAELFGRGDLLR
ncbi:ankyrin repeat domain-containing protein [Flexivirga caeni]|uniref:Ankyrin repeat domain-containing protein n=1 Tax=Flexivirga caeni TaxID=2294115 RepID=A0A3M9M556_9MICO|nr:ankyrin repeat domain-containing protein [Flexivirga caeni]RNI20636.1 ankyrin repeat domain-containing protein [Flexivirga caeni]